MPFQEAGRFLEGIFSVHPLSGKAATRRWVLP
jgi:hypothetical protein